MKRIFLTWILLSAASGSFAQIKSDSIEIRKRFGTVFRQHGKNLTPRLLLTIVRPNAEAYNEMKIAKSNYDAASVFGFTGGFLIGWPVGTSLGGGKPDWTLAGIGAGLIVVSIPFSTSFTKHAKHAVKLYNDGLATTGYTKVDFKIGLNSNGLALRMLF